MTPGAPWLVAVLGGVAAASWALTGWLRQYALDRQMVDVPNARSSHRVTTPRGGGGGIVVAATVALAWWGWSSGSVALAAIIGGGLIVAAVGFVDDHRHVPPMVRLVGHTAAAVVLVMSLSDAALGIAGFTVAAVFVVWLINLTNFMDGIDGIAGVQTAIVCGCGAVLYAIVLPGSGLWIEPAVLAAASLGFLIWNWPPARVFMGDVGSGFVGFMVAAFTLLAALLAPALGWSWLILSGVFIVDATITLLRRAARRERLFQAHRSHAYQHLAAAWGSHRAVTLLVAAINLCWLTPMAILVATHHLSGPVGLLIAYLPLAFGVLRLGAGTSHRP